LTAFLDKDTLIITELSDLENLPKINLAAGKKQKNKTRITFLY
jgi:hypothetical protein